MKPIQIKRTPEETLMITWDDTSIVNFPYQFLREECPCAGCQGETLLLGKHFDPKKPATVLPRGYEILKLELVGNYAMQIQWGDGHDTGIYSWDYLQQLQTELSHRTSESSELQ